MNHLEELVREYYEYQGWFVRTNVRFNKLSHGGYKGEADVLALNPDPNSAELVHVECTEAAFSDSDLKNLADKKFQLTNAQYAQLLGFQVKTVLRVFIVGQSGVSKEGLMPTGVKHKSLKAFFKEVNDSISKDFLQKAVPESFPLLRTMQLVKWSL